MYHSKHVLSILLTVVMLLLPARYAFGDDISQIELSPQELESATVADPSGADPSSVMPLSKDSEPLTIPGGKGTLTSNAWRSSSYTVSGNTLKWDYQVSAVYSGNRKVSKIRTTWKGSASLRNSASINLGISSSGGSAGAGGGWQYVSTVAKYWENNNGAKEASYRSNMVVAPARDYRSDTISIVNTARVQLSGDKKSYEISASC
ncbi:hypothetical protein EMB92_09270 [Bifidobacterium callitrichos]|uniref:Uncharacterized protein n=2 Tax=Bifidobacterium callitrichos TaxID=762209 RepID=A0A5M9ZB71_9BIFI|nr:hypothetical protein EMB92_09270 [Bifidobacterium callitrichos]